jgi:low affinity Fe/Cu permease
MREAFRKFAHAVSNAVGTPAAFLLALLSIVVWGATGPAFGYSDTWQLVINTATTIITFLMVFLIQNTQNRDAKAIHLKLDELIRGVRGARTRLVDLEELSDEELDRLQTEFRALQERLNARGRARPEGAATEKGHRRDRGADREE